MTIYRVAGLLAFAFMLSVGQILVKKAVIAVKGPEPQVLDLRFAFNLFTNWQFLLAIGICASLVVVWAWTLTFIPLSKAYPFVVCAFVFAGILEYFIFGVPLSPRFFIGCGLIALGLIVIL